MNGSAMVALLPRINAEMERCLSLAAVRYCREFKRPTLAFRALGRTGGCAQPSTWTITLNSSLLLTSTDDVIGQTLPHEIAHLIHYALVPQDYAKNSRRKHGPHWAAVMRLFGKPANRCHSMDTTLSARTVRRLHTYGCVCGREHTLGPRHHARVQRFEAHGLPHGVRWKACAQPLDAKRYLGLSKQTQEILAARQVARQEAKR